MARRFSCYKDVIPLCAMIAVECSGVGVNVFFKAATVKGLSYYVFILYAFAVSSLLLLLPLPFVFRWSRGLPPFRLSLLLRILPLAVIGLVAQLCNYKAIEYSSPTLASAISTLTPAFTFILAVFFRMERAALGSSSTQAKIVGSVVSITGALIVVLYRGPVIIIPSSSSPLNSPLTDDSSTTSSQWILGGFLLVIVFLLAPIWYILQTHVINHYPSEIIVVFLFNLCGTIVSAPVCLFLESNLTAWKIKPDITLVAILFSGVFSTGIGSLIHTWGLHLKGPVYVTIFKPLSIAIAAVVSVIFLGDALYLGSIIGAAILSIGFYVVIWGKAKEEDEVKENNAIVSSTPSSITKTPLLIAEPQRAR